MSGIAVVLLTAEADPAVELLHDWLAKRSCRDVFRRVETFLPRPVGGSIWIGQFRSVRPEELLELAREVPWAGETVVMVRSVEGGAWLIVRLGAS